MFPSGRLPLLLAAVLMWSASGVAQTPDAPPQLNFSGVIFGNFQYRTDDAARATNRFELERAYLTLRVAASERTSVRVTTDVYQQQRSGDDAYYRGWAIRAKYAYIQHDFLKKKEWSAYARIGMLSTAVVEHIELFWPRFLSQVAVERAGFFSSSDVGVSGQLGLPRKLGEVVAVVSNGPGYTSREIDRFKDYAARLSLSPLARSSYSPLVKSLTVSAWAYKGALASKFATPLPESRSTINEALQRDRYGVFAGIRDSGATLGAEFAMRYDEGEAGANSLASPRVLTDSTGTVASAFIVARPLQLVGASSSLPLSIVARRDWVSLNRDAERGYSVTIAGVLWDLSRRTTIALDYQVQIPDKTTNVPVVKTAFVHYVTTF